MVLNFNLSTREVDLSVRPAWSTQRVQYSQENTIQTLLKRGNVMSPTGLRTPSQAESEGVGLHSHPTIMFTSKAEASLCQQKPVSE